MRENFKSIKCDLCGKTLEYKEREQYHKDPLWIDRHTDKEVPQWKTVTMPVVFLTEQNEGTPCKPHFSNETFDMCPDCYQKFIDTYPITAWGAQGFNRYEWREK